MTKLCRDCNQEQPAETFLRSKRSKDGLGHLCRACRRERGRKKNLEIKMGLRPKEAEQRLRCKRENNRRVRRSRNPARLAQAAIYIRVRKGTLIRPEHCSQCGQTGKIEAHHDDYSKPLEVRWLCRICHLRQHGKEPIALTTGSAG